MDRPVKTDGRVNLEMRLLQVKALRGSFQVCLWKSEEAKPQKGKGRERAG